MGSMTALLALLGNMPGEGCRDPISFTSQLHHGFVESYPGYGISRTIEVDDLGFFGLDAPAGDTPRQALAQAQRCAGLVLDGL